MHLPLTQLAARLARSQPDGELLARFVRERDEAAFAVLVHRHGPTVYGVFRRVLGNSPDAEDAFQAVFLVLVRRAEALTDRPALGSWLHGVAVRVSEKARTAFARLRKHERRAAGTRAEPVLDPPPADPSAWLDRELAALPERYREPVVLCLIQDRPRAEVAAELGIPEGTLASRLDAARKRLTERLARHRLPLALGGLLVPVPAALTAATAGRATDGSGVAIHQLANEVTKMMVSKAKWVALGAVGALTAFGGLLLAASGVGSPVPRPLDPTREWPEHINKQSRVEPPVPEPLDNLVAHRAAPVPPEPAWMTAFRKKYELKDGEYVKYIAPPYIDERKEYMYRVWYKNKQTPEAEERAREHLDREKLFLALFLDFDGTRLTHRTALASTGYLLVPELEKAGKMLNVWDAVGCVTGLQPPEVVIDPKSSDHPLLSAKDRLIGSVSVRGNPSLTGDFVTRKGAPLEKLAPQLEKIFREECKLDVRLTVKEEEQTVYVVGGTFKPNPPEWRPKKELDFYATEEGLNKEFDHFDPNKNATLPKFATVDTQMYIGPPVDLVRSVGNRLQTRMVWDTPLPTGPRVSWHQHTFLNPSKEQAAADRDPEKVLAVVTAQTGLSFKKETRRVQVLSLSVPEQK